MKLPITENDVNLMVTITHNNSNLPLANILRKKTETTKQSKARQNLKKAPTGIDLIPDYCRRNKLQLKNVSKSGHPQLVDISQFPKDIVRSGFELISCWTQQRIDAKVVSKLYETTRFIFIPSNLVDTEDEEIQSFLNHRGKMLVKMQFFADLALWQSRIFRNPYYDPKKEDSDPVPGLHALSFNFDGRQPIHETNNLNCFDKPTHSAKWKLRFNGKLIFLDPM